MEVPHEYSRALPRMSSGTSGYYQHDGKCRFRPPRRLPLCGGADGQRVLQPHACRSPESQGGEPRPLRADDEFKNFRQLHSILQGHPDCKKVPGIDASTGSLGQGCSIAVGMALGAKLQGKDTKVFAMLGDGECQEGQIWEALMSAAHYKLDNLTVMVDNNGLQIDGSNNEVMSLGDLAAKLRAFGFDLYEIDGHDLDAIEAALSAPVTAGKPKAILAHTVKGKGISFMENQVGWHGKAPNEEQRQQALKELED